MAEHPGADDPAVSEAREADEARVVEALVAALREPGAGAAIDRDLAGFYAAHGLAGATLAAMVARGPRHLKMYRTMVRGRLRRVLGEFLPRTLARLGERRLAADFAGWLVAAGSQTVIFREVPEEFFVWAGPRWAADPELPPYLGDLARHELLGSAVRHAEGGREPVTGVPLAVDRPLVFDGTVRLRSYAFAVHRLPLDVADRSPPEAIASAVLAYRDRENYRVRYIELTPRAAAILGRLVAGEAVREALIHGAADAGEVFGDELLAAMTHLFADLSQRGVILGAPAGEGF